MVQEVLIQGLIFIWLFANLRKILLLLYWIQTKEYRLDRLLVFLNTKEGKIKTKLFFLLVKIPIASLFFLTYHIEEAKVVFLSLYFALLFWETIKFIYEIKSKLLKRPQITLRAILTLTLSFPFLTFPFILWVFYSIFDTKILIFADITNYFILFIINFLISLPIKIVVDIKEKKAKKILEKYHPKVIAITGSYGKSSTKHLIHEILTRAGIKSVKTPRSYNTRLGIINTITQKINSKTEYFVCEVGAYKKGEIEKICSFLKPDLSMITGICPQHLSLFKSLKNIQEAKYEITKNLKKRGFLLLNTTDQKFTKPILSMAKKDGIKVMTYALNKRADFWASIEKKKKKDEQELNFISPQKRFIVKTPIKDKAYLENLVGAISLCLILKIPHQKISRIVKDIKEIESQIKIKKITSKITILDDSFSSNPKGFINAINFLSNFKGFKMVITEGIQELGNKSFSIHKEIGKELKKVDLVLVTSPSLLKPFSIAIGNGKTKIKLIKSTITKKEVKKLINFYPVTILIEGRIPSSILETVYNINKKDV